MKVINSTVDIIKQGSGFEGLCEHIKYCSSIESSLEDLEFIDSLFMDYPTAIKAREWLRHGTVRCGDKIMDYATALQGDYDTWSEAVQDSFSNKGCLLDTLDECTERITAEFTISRALARKFMEYRIMAATISRCDEVAFVLPPNINGKPFDLEVDDVWFINLANRVERTVGPLLEHDDAFKFFQTCGGSEKMHDKLTYLGWSTDYADLVLPDCTATKLIMTGTLEEWNILFEVESSENILQELKTKIDYDKEGV